MNVQRTLRAIVLATTIGVCAAALVLVTLAGCKPSTNNDAPRPMGTAAQLGECDHEDGNENGTPCYFEGEYVDSSEYKN